jgi:hypothetical protein
MENSDEVKGQIERIAYIWCKVRGYPYQCYKKWNKIYKSILNRIICEPQQPVSTKQREDLINYMFSFENFIAGRDSFDPLDSIPTNKQDIMLSPLTPEEIKRYFSRY